MYSADDDKGETIIIIEKSEGQALVRALELCIAPKLDGIRPLQKSSKAYKVANEINHKLCCF